MSARRAHTLLVSVDDAFAGDVDITWLRRLARLVLDAEGVPPAELSVLVTDDDTVRALNRDYAGEDRATDVLSFSLREGEEFAAPPGGPLPLGEVIIACPTAARQAREAGRPLRSEIAHLLVHGLLHLLGYDHAQAEEERRMRAREEELLAGDAVHRGL